jgi:hypothetical protein
VRILVDTSAWVDFFNGFDSPEARRVASVLRGPHDVVTCGVVVAEVFQGLRDPHRREQLAVLFRKMEFLEATGIGLHLRAADLFRALRGRGVTVRSTIDCLIAVLAEEHACAILQKDRDLGSIVASGLLRLPRLPS